MGIGIYRLIQNFFVHNLLIEIYRKCVSFRTHKIMGDNSLISEIKVLTERLAEAENKIKVLNAEVGDIKIQINSLQTKCCQDAAGTSIRQYSTASKRNFSEISNSSSDVDNKLSAKKKFSSDFVMEEDYAVVYTDGACENNGKLIAKAGIGVWFGDHHPLNLSKPVVGRATNNTAEIQACVSAIKIAHENGIRQLLIKTDSQFVINAMTGWIHKWKKNSWKVISGGDVKNKEDFIILDDACKLLDKLKWEHVKGHCGLKGNDEADKLAREGAKLYIRC